VTHFGKLSVNSSRIWPEKLIGCRLKNWEVKLSGILEKWDFWGIFFRGMLVFGVKTGFGGSNCRVWANQARKRRSKTFKNIRKRSKIFKNIQNLSTNV